VHSFLLRHVYGATISTYKISRTSAMFLTFLLSACVHELVMAIVTQKLRCARANLAGMDDRLTDLAQDVSVCASGKLSWYQSRASG
jgi:hypothetical protein